MHGVRKIFGWSEVWVNGDCVAIYGPQKEWDAYESAKHHWCDLTNKRFPILLD